MDDTDRRLLALLREDARAPTAELARRLSLSRTTVQSRIARLEREGLIAGYTVKVSDAAEKGWIRAFINVTAAPKQAGGVEQALRRMPEVRALYSVNGAFDMVAEAATPSIGEMDGLIDAIGALAGVERTTSSIVLSTKFNR